MDTQNTPIHLHLWHREFWFLAFANLLLSMSVYMLIPVMPGRLAVEYYTPVETGLIMGVFGIGIFLFGGFISYLVQRYPRSRVCRVSIWAMVAVLVALYEFDRLADTVFDFPMMLLLRLLLGAFYGVAQMILVSTLVNDVCESFQRTEADHAATWFSRFALSLGPVVALFIERYLNFGSVVIVSLGCAVAAIILIMLVNFPFRAPEETLRYVSCDRFFLTQSSWLFLNLVLMTTMVGLLLSFMLDIQFYALLMVGFILAILAEKYAFANAELKSETVTGLILVGAAALLMWRRDLPVVNHAAPVMMGFGFGIIGSRFQLFFIKLARHCQRGTALSTFFLAWELGVAIGLFAGYCLFEADRSQVLATILSLSVVSLLLYHTVTHPWYLKHKNR